MSGNSPRIKVIYGRVPTWIRWILRNVGSATISFAVGFALGGAWEEYTEEGEWHLEANNRGFHCPYSLFKEAKKSMELAFSPSDRVMKMAVCGSIRVNGKTVKEQLEEYLDVYSKCLQSTPTDNGYVIEAKLGEEL